MMFKNVCGVPVFSDPFAIYKQLDQLKMVNEMNFDIDNIMKIENLIKNPDPFSAVGDMGIGASGLAMGKIYDQLSAVNKEIEFLHGLGANKIFTELSPSYKTIADDSNWNWLLGQGLNAFMPINKTVVGYNKIMEQNKYALGLAADISSRLGSMATEILNAGRFGPETARYFEENPLTNMEWAQAFMGFNGHDSEEFEVVLQTLPTDDSTEEIHKNRPNFVKYFSWLIACSMVPVLTMLYGDPANSVITKVLLNRFASFFDFLSWLHFGEMIAAAKNSIKNHRKPIPMARVISSSGKMVPVHKSANEKSPSIRNLYPDSFVLLNGQSTKKMKAIVLTFDRWNNPETIGWVAHKNLKRINHRKSTDFKLMLSEENSDDEHS